MNLLKDTLEQIKGRNIEAEKAAMDKIDKLAKPIGSLGTLEKIASKIAGITGSTSNRISRRNIIVMCADNGVVEEGVSAAPKEITAILLLRETRKSLLCGQAYIPTVTVLQNGDRNRLGYC